MPNSDQLSDPRDPRIALGLLTRVPLGADLRQAAERGANAAWAFPLVGLIVGAIAAGVGVAGLWIGLAAGPVAALVVFAQVMLTGAMHEDGLADTADGLWRGWDPARRLEIMKDSRIGAYGVIALVLSLLIRVMMVAMLAALGGWALLAGIIAASCISRASMVSVMTLMDPARESGLSASVGQPAMATMVMAWVLAALAAVGLVGLEMVPSVIAAVFVMAVMMSLAKARIGGQTGDILGATQQVSEIAVLMVLTAGL